MSLGISVHIRVKLLLPSVCEENLIEIRLNEECQLMFFYDRWRALTDEIH